MTLPEIEEKYNKNISALKALEQILKAQEASYDVHVLRITWLKQLADTCNDLRRYEVESIRSQQIAAQQAQAREEAARLAQIQAQPQSQPEVVVAPTPVAAEQEVAKKARKKSE